MSRAGRARRSDAGDDCSELEGILYRYHPCLRRLKGRTEIACFVGRWSSLLELKRRAHRPAAAIQHVRVYLRGGEVSVSEQLLNRANIIALFKQVRGEAM